jgi:hypothetical protein
MLPLPPFTCRGDSPAINLKRSFITSQPAKWLQSTTPSAAGGALPTLMISFEIVSLLLWINIILEGLEYL